MKKRRIETQVIALIIATEKGNAPLMLADFNDQMRAIADICPITAKREAHLWLARVKLITRNNHPQD